MADIIDTLYRLRNMAGIEAARLRAAIDDAEAVWAKLAAFANDAEYAAELTASSDRFPTHFASVPKDSGFERATGQEGQ